MARPKSYKKVKTINFDIDVLEALETKCRKAKISVSQFMNILARSVVISDFEFFRAKAKMHAAKLAEYQLLMDSAPDKPQEIIC